MDSIIRLIELLGTLAFAATGIIEARKKGMDLVGVYFVAMITAFGGGTVRDVLLGRYPLFWIKHDWYPVLLFGLSLFSALIVRTLYENRRMAATVTVLDALGLGLFSAAGTLIAHQHGCTFFIAALLGVVTGIFGGIMRDIICNEIPSVFRRTELYATCAFLGGCTFLALSHFDMETAYATTISIGVTFITRMASLRYRITLPL